MANLLGDHLFEATPECWRAVFAMPNVHVHMYGKAEARTGRKMGHLTTTAGSAKAAEDLVVATRRKLQR
jgi:5-(carboxyamino)imidazole ribonucleotide synthase